jgi:hypothetical protein
VTYKRVIVSDLSGDVFREDEQVGTLTILSHPTHGARMPVRLHATPEEWGKRTLTPVIIVEYRAPDGSTERGAMLVTDFEALASDGVDLDAVIAEQSVLQRPPEPARPRRRQGGGRKPSGYYSSSEHAGEPHNGRPTQSEISMIHMLGLEVINARLRDSGLREIDPSDPVARKRYQLDRLADKITSKYFAEGQDEQQGQQDELQLEQPQATEEPA